MFDYQKKFVFCQNIYPSIVSPSFWMVPFLLSIGKDNVEHSLLYLSILFYIYAEHFRQFPILGLVW